MTKPPVDWDAFRRWLVTEGFAPTTARDKAIDARTWVTTYAGDTGTAVTEDRRRKFARAVELLREWAKDYDVALPTFEDPPAAPEKKRKRPKAKERVRIPFDRSEYRALRQHLKQPRVGGTMPALAALHLMVRNPLRVGDVLRIETKALGEALEREDGRLILRLKGGKEAQTRVSGRLRPLWQQLYDGTQLRGATTVADAISKGSSSMAGDAAYAAVNRTFKALCAELEVQPPHNLHRLRHTVATLLVEDLHLGDKDVQRVLVHDRLQTTRIYTGGAHAQDASDIIDRFDEVYDSTKEDT